MMDKCLNKIFVVSADEKAAYRYAGQYLGITSNEVEVLDSTEKIIDIDDYRVCVLVPYILDGNGPLIDAALHNNNIEFIYPEIAHRIGSTVGAIIKETFDVLPINSYPAAVLKDFIQQRLHSRMGTLFTFDFNFNYRNGNIEMVPLNQPTAAYLILSRKYFKGV